MQFTIVAASTTVNYASKSFIKLTPTRTSKLSEQQLSAKCLYVHLHRQNILQKTDFKIQNEPTLKFVFS